MGSHAMIDFFIERRIYYHNTDSGGVVYYANYFLFLEEGRAEFLRKNGADTSEYARQGIAFPVVRVDVEYKAPARYGDLIKIFTKIERTGNSSIHFAQEIKRGEALLVRAKTVWACVGPDFQAVTVPDAVRKALND